MRGGHNEKISSCCYDNNLPGPKGDSPIEGPPIVGPPMVGAPIVGPPTGE